MGVWVQGKLRLIWRNSGSKSAQNADFSQKSGDQLLDYSTAKLGQLFVPSGVVVGEAVVIESEKVKKRDVDITDVMNALDRFGADFVSGTDCMACFGASASKPHGHCLGIVIATVRLPATAKTVVWCATEFSAPYDESVFK